MMGFGSLGPMSWISGALAMITIWGGVWWLLSSLVFHSPSHRDSSPALTPPTESEPSQSWQQPSFTHSSVAGPTEGAVGVRPPIDASGSSSATSDPKPESELR